ncbi:MAG TPA: rhodanese-like domain-containing protein [Pyrinomonadaceae bacterium]
MTDNLKSKVEIIVNVIIAVAVVIVAGISLKNYFFRDKGSAGQQQQQQSQIVVGARINVPNVNWEENRKTLVFFLKKDCPYCTSSAPFYRQLIEEASKRGVRLLAIVPHSVEEGRDYIKSLGLPIENIQSGSLTSYRIPGTPTVLLVDNTGKVRSVWVGGVSPDREQEIKDNLIPLFEADITLNDLRTQPANQISGTPGGKATEDIDAAELKKIIEGKQKVTIVDVDQREDYKSEHIPDAKNIPGDEIFSRASRELPKDYRVVIYCRCKGEGASTGAKSELLKQGFPQVSVLKGGLAAWKDIGMPTTVPPK